MKNVRTSMGKEEKAMSQTPFMKTLVLGNQGESAWQEGNLGAGCGTLPDP